MDAGITRSVAAVAVVMATLLAGCGTASAQSDSPPAAPSSAAVAPGIDAAAPANPSPGADSAAQQTRQVQAATERFVRTVLTIGYPDRTFGDYTDRIEPLMTKGGFDSLESTDSIKKGSTALKTLYGQRARSAPTFSADPEVISMDATSTTAQLAYENVAQQKSGSSWTTLKSLGEGRVTIKLVLVDGTWLVDDAS